MGMRFLLLFLLAITGSAAQFDRAMTGGLLTNCTLWVSNQYGLFKVPHFDPITFADRAQFLDQSNFVIMEIRHSGIAPNGTDEGGTNNVIYFGGQEDYDAFSFNLPDIGDQGRITFVFNSEAYQWRLRNNRLAIDPGSGGTDQYLIFRHDNGTNNIWFGDSNLVTHLEGKHVEIPSTSFVTNALGPSILFGVAGPPSGGANGSLFLSTSNNGMMFLRTNGAWVIK